MTVTQAVPGQRSHAELVRDHVAQVAGALTGRLNQVTSQMSDLLASKIEELDLEPLLLDMLHASVEGNVVTILRALEYQIPPDRLEPPSAAVEYARRLAQRGISMNALVRAYRLGQQDLMREAFAASEAVGSAEAVRADAFEEVVQTCFDYIDWISQRVIVVYEAERESWLANQSNARDAKVREILAGAEVEVTAAEDVLGFRLRGHHVAVVAWTSEAGLRDDQFSRSTKAMRELAARIGGGRPLVVGCDRATVWGWIPLPREWRFDRELTRWRDADRPGPVMALGSRGAGVEGFRRSHNEALQVHRVASLGGQPERMVLSHDEPGMAATALLSHNLTASRDWVRSVLGELVRDDDVSARHRLTLLEFLRHDMNYTATAEAMMMHKNSIKYRLTAAEAALPVPLLDNRLDIELALTACAWLGPAMIG
ncbi:PucR family transcriptional regulator [Nocardioides daejeonensis]|uniref:PucR family transcriptional regulator n=1 Tax=Nocardioides daejeonensis TaxID=1046556 RepID=UPI000D741105|nr:helix-turn-helix domain-containing protein [Nocardioides daejeonensis]